MQSFSIHSATVFLADRGTISTHYTLRDTPSCCQL